MPPRSAATTPSRRSARRRRHRRAASRRRRARGRTTMRVSRQGPCPPPHPTKGPSHEQHAERRRQPPGAPGVATVGMTTPQQLGLHRRAGGRAGRRRGAGQDAAVVAGPGHARLAQRRQELHPPVGIGEVMRAGGIGRVVASKDPAFAVGDVVSGLLGVQEYCHSAAGLPGSRSLQKVDLRLGTPSTVAQRLRHARNDRLLRPEGRGPAAGRRDRWSFPARPAPSARPSDSSPRSRAAGRRHCRRQGQMRLGGQGTGLRRLHRLQRRLGARRPEGALP